MPNPLPPPLEYDATLIRSIHEAASALGGVASIYQFVPNPALLVIPFLNLEAVMSSRIEGTVTTTEALFEANVAPLSEVTEPTREVANYLKAMNRGMELLKEIPISLRLVRELHRTLLDNTRGDGPQAGLFRSQQVHIGRRGRPISEASYVPPPPNLIPQLMDDWEKYLHKDATPSPLVHCAILHAQFEMIHPFSDGNGRLGRLLMSLLLISEGHLPQPLLFLSAYFERFRDEYLSSLAQISTEGNWRDWVIYFLEAVRVQSDAAVAAAKAITNLREQMREQIGTTHIGQLHRVIDLLFENPVVTVAFVAERLGMTQPTAARAIEKLQEHGFLLETTGKTRYRRYAAVPILRAIEQATLAPGE
ncbi:MAG: Fic family protein [Armatimonadia bacterium]